MTTLSSQKLLHSIATQFSLPARRKQFRRHRPWSYGRGYTVIAGITVLVLGSLVILHLHQLNLPQQVQSQFKALRDRFMLS